MTASLLNVSVDDYHADEISDAPTLNATVAKSLILETPAHARQKHPRLADQYEPKVSAAMDDGTALHQLLLGDDRVDVLDYAEFRTNEAKAARDASRALGRVPIKRDQWARMETVARSLRAQLAALPVDPPLFTEGMAEQTIVWDEDGVMCRARLDWLRRDYAAVDDLKKARTADPKRFQKSIFTLGYDIQAAFYVRACRAAFGVEPVFRWVAIEPVAPYAMSVHVLSPKAMHAAQDKVDLALTLWRECLDSGRWPAYPQTVLTVHLPAWLEPEWDDTALTEAPF